MSELKAKLTDEYKDALEQPAASTYYRIVEVSSEFIRLRGEAEERIIPYASIREFRRSVSR